MSSEIKVTNIKHSSSGSNNLVLASDGSATATLSSTSVVPASVGSSLVLVKSAQGFTVDTGTTTSSAYMQNCFNSTYRDYVVYITGTMGTTQGGLHFRYGNSSGRNSNANYFFVIKGYDSLDNSRQDYGQAVNSATILNGINGDPRQLFDRFVIQLTFHNPQASGGIVYTGTCSYPRAGTSFFINYIGGYYRVEDYSATNMQLYFSSGSGTFNFQSYGIKTS